MSQMNYGGFGDLDPDRSQPRYQPGSTGPTSRPSDWPSPDSSTNGSNYNPGSGTGSYQPPVEGSYGKYQPGNPVNGSGPRYDYNRYSQPRPYNYNDYSDYNDYDGYGAQEYGMRPPVYNDPQQLAAAQAQAKRSFYRHLTIYLLVNLFMWPMSVPLIILSHGHFTPFFITLFWGIGLFFQYQRTFGRGFRLRHHRMIGREMRYMRRTMRRSMRHRW